MTPMLLLSLAWAGLVLAAIPAFLTVINLRLFRGPPAIPAGSRPKVSVLVPARNEERAISRLVFEVLASEAVDLELVILDDASEDDTAAIVARLAESDGRLRPIAGRPLPTGWCGKQHACWQLAHAARFETLVFLDVDVTLTPDAIARAVAFLENGRASLVSGFPHQRTVGKLDWLLLPLINYVLMGYLPLDRARQVNAPSLAAGCGQFFVTRRADYEKAGGHEAIASSLHDGVKLPRAYRSAGLVTDIFDATEVASCQMYLSERDVWRGLSKNATEGIGAPATIVPFTILLGGGSVLPVVVAGIGLGTGFDAWPTGGSAVVLSGLAVSFFPRALDAVRFRQSRMSALLHPLGVAVLLAIQWVAIIRKSLGLRTSWRGRSLAPQ